MSLVDADGLDSAAQLASSSKKAGTTSPFIKSTDTWEEVKVKLIQIGWTEPTQGSFLIPNGHNILSENDLKDFVKENYGWGARVSSRRSNTDEMGFSWNAASSDINEVASPKMDPLAAKAAVSTVTTHTSEVSASQWSSSQHPSSPQDTVVDLSDSPTKPHCALLPGGKQIAVIVKFEQGAQSHLDPASPSVSIRSSDTTQCDTASLQKQPATPSTDDVSWTSNLSIAAAKTCDSPLHHTVSSSTHDPPSLNSAAAVSSDPICGSTSFPSLSTIAEKEKETASLNASPEKQDVLTNIDIPDDFKAGSGPLLLLEAGLANQRDILPKISHLDIDTSSLLESTAAYVVLLLDEGQNPRQILEILKIRPSSEELVVRTIRTIKDLYLSGRSSSGLNAKLKNTVLEIRKLFLPSSSASPSSSTSTAVQSEPEGEEGNYESGDDFGDTSISRFEEWVSVREKLGDMGMRMRYEMSAGYVYIIGKSPKEGGVAGEDYFTTLGALQDYVKITFGWYGMQRLSEGNIVRLTPQGSEFVNDIPEGLVAKYYVVWERDHNSHICKIVPLEKNGKFGIGNGFDSLIAGRDKWMCVSYEKCKGFDINENLIDEIVEAKRIVSKNYEKQQDLSSDEWHIMPNAAGGTSTKRTQTSRHVRSQKAAKVSALSSPRDTHIASETRTILVDNDIVGGPRALVEAVMENKDGILAQLNKFSFDKSSIFETAAAFVLSKYEETGAKIIEGLKLDPSDEENVKTVIGKIKRFGRDGENASGRIGLNKELKKAAIKLGGQFLLSSKDSPDPSDVGALGYSPEGNLPCATDTETHNVKYEAQLSVLREDMQKHKEQLGKLLHVSKEHEKLIYGLGEELQCPIELEFPKDPVLAVDVEDEVATMYDRSALEAHLQLQREKNQTLTLPNTNKEIEGSPLLVSCPQLKGAISSISSMSDISPTSIALSDDPAREKCRRLQKELHSAEIKHLEEQSKATEKIQGELAKRLDLLSEIRSLRDNEAKMSCLESDLAETKAQAYTHQTTISRLEDALSKSRAENDALSQKVQESEKKIAFLTAKNNIIETNETVLHRKVASLSNDLEVAIDEYTSLSASTIATEEKISSLEKALSDKQNDINDLKSEMSKLDEELERVKSLSHAALDASETLTAPDNLRETNRLQRLSETLSAEHIKLEKLAVKAIASAIGGFANEWFYSGPSFDVANMLCHVGKIKAVQNFIRQLKIEWPQQKLPMVDMVMYLLESFLQRHGPSLEAGHSIAPSLASELAVKCRLVYLVLRHILWYAKWPETDNNYITLKMIVEQIPLPMHNSA